ncbi:NAD(P)/FAD-dependent oxidoreductase [Allorhizobium taibaishanense]|uniref:Amino acid dehydrogenase n=1 Tax=Allorhizobium taibaishanense TaxID=887144 RepID=A0A1Q9ABI8_9HYPH|nr:FAD-binding oxidoreductase [Allorhizobium taibaishanense]MBB4010152.1 D-amino-acid dehydrogenase [Allorhizobium taibaishanense]OLP52221.1 amino acid dehydrogenase [Allorhizobium taibaishanense]
MSVDAIVLGAGIVGVSTAVQLARRGKSVVLVDRRGAGEETSFGNAGLIQREGLVPYAFPQDLGLILRYGLNNRIDAHYHLTALPKVFRFLSSYFWHSNPARHAVIARSYAPLIENSINEHKELIEAAGAERFIRKDGWVEAFRTGAVRDKAATEAERLAREYGIDCQVLTSEELARAEPHLSRDFIGALKWNDPWSVLDPEGLTKAYLAYFESLGGRFVKGDAKSLKQVGSGWQVMTDDGTVDGAQLVLALGPWAGDITTQLGYNLPLGVKRGYHMHYGSTGNAVLNNWLMDKERGYFLNPMTQGIRLTTGAEFALRDAPKTPVQLARAEAVARTIFPLAERLDAEPWMGARPCTPDMMPVIGKAPRHKGLWFAFGHAHHGLTLGPVTGRLLAEAMYGETPFLDITPYRPERFGA